MNLAILQCIWIISLLHMVRIAHAEDFSITPNEAVEVKQRLEAYENGGLDFDQLVGSDTQESCRQLIGYYITHTNKISTKEKLPISQCYIGSGKFVEAAELAHEYVNVYSNDFDGWEILGYCHVALEDHNSAIHDYTVAVNLGDTNSYEPLAGEAVQAHRIDIVQKILPQLMALQRASETSQDHKINLTTILTGYSLIANRKDIFIKTLDGHNLKELLQNDIIRKNVTSGCQMFQGKGIDKIREEMEAALGSKARSRLNSIWKMGSGKSLNSEHTNERLNL
jgi:hypothetical protein